MPPGYGTYRSVWLVLEILLDLVMSAFVNIVLINSPNFAVDFHGKRIEFRVGICDTDLERKIVCTLCMLGIYSRCLFEIT